MPHKLARRLLGGAVLAALLGAAPAAATEVTVRVEGQDATRVQQVELTTPGGTVGKSSSRRCPGDSPLGALDKATGGAWDGGFVEGLGYFISTIRGEEHGGAPSYWSLWIDNAQATAGVCQAEIEDGDDILFLVDRCDYDVVTQGCTNRPVLPLALRLPARRTADTPFTVRVVRYSAAGRARNVEGASVRIAGRVYETDDDGEARVTVPTGGRRYRVRAFKDGYARSAYGKISIRRP